MKIAAIDIGTNSMRLLIADYEEGKFKERKKFINPTRIGQGVNKEGVIQTDAFERNIKALKDFVNQAKEEGCSHILAMGTSALRDSKNSKEFVERAHLESGINVEILEGEVEACMGFMGAIESLSEKEENVLVIDIGGGSTEFIVGNKNGIEFSKSENVGVVRMTEKFLISDPATKKEINELKLHLQITLEDTLEKLIQKNIKKIIGIGGTITSCASMIQEMQVYDMEKTHQYVLKDFEIDCLIEKLKPMNVKEKQMIKGLHPKRADVMFAGLLIVEHILKKLSMDRIVVSEYDNLEGLITSKNGLKK